MILLHNVVQEFHLPEFRKVPERLLLLQSFCRSGVSGILVDRDGLWTDRMRLFQRIMEGILCSSRISPGREQEVDCFPAASTAR